MNIKSIYPEIAPDIYYVGVDDNATPLFENLWPLPNGVSYNSYLITGSSATALIDAVALDSLPQLLENLIALSVKGIDYLIVNHMEPDHSGSIPELLLRFPQMKIIGNKKTAEMLQGFYGIAGERVITVANGDTLSLGNVTLRFMLTPMVHWPETMMTYIEERSTLFSGDAFGGFSALSGRPLASENDVNKFTGEIYRYYACIVAKYGRFVQGAIGKLKEADINPDIICPTHGLVWNGTYASSIVNLYSRMSRWESEKGVVIAVGSMYGHTTRMAHYLAALLAQKGVKNVKIHEASFENLSAILADVMRYGDLIIGSATYSMDLFPPVRALLEALKIREIKNRRLAIFSSYTWAPDAAQKCLQKWADEVGLTVVAKGGMKQNLFDETSLDEIVANIGN